MNIRVEYNSSGLCSIFHSCFDNTPFGEMRLDEFVADFSLSKKALIEKIRNCEDEDEKKRMKLRLPCITPSGVFTARRADGLRTPSGYLSIDLDNLGRDISTTTKKLIGFPGLAYCGLSVRGNGLFCIIKIQKPENYTEHLNAVFQDMINMGLNPDPACRDICRLRFVSYDPNPVINFDVAPYDKQILTHQPAIIPNGHNGGAIAERVERCLEQIEERRLDITNDYRVWIVLAYSLGNEFGEKGREYFHRVSRYYSEYDPRETDHTFTACLKGSNITISSFFYHCKKNGIRW